jgi:hypothetical protein
MTSLAVTRRSILTMLNDVGFGVLATEHAGQPHTSLVAITPLDAGRHVLFATYRDTRKFRNLTHNTRVSLLMDGRSRVGACSTETCLVLSAVGQVHELGAAFARQALDAHRLHHPQLEGFLNAPDCVLMQVEVEAYQVVNGIDDVSWWPVHELLTVPTDL